MTHPVQLVRVISKRTSYEKIQAQIEWLIGRALNSSRGSGWEVISQEIHDPVEMGEDNKELFRRILRDFVTAFQFALPEVGEQPPSPVSTP